MENSIYEINRPMVSAEAFDGETVVIHFDTGNYYSLGSLASIVWKAVEEQGDLDQLAEILEKHYGRSRTELVNLIEKVTCEFLREGLIRPAESPAAIDLERKLCPFPPGPLADDTGGLTKFDDLQEMLLMDPIHDVDETGWPHANQSEN